MGLKKSKDWYMGEFEGKKVRGNDIFLKIKNYILSINNFYINIYINYQYKKLKFFN